MATNYTMGQLFYNGSEDTKEYFTTVVNTYPDKAADNSRLISVETVVDDDGCYKDVLIPLEDKALSRDDWYYLNMHIMPSGVANTTYCLKLVNKDEYIVKNEEGAEEEDTGFNGFVNYETVDTFTVPAIDLSDLGVAPVGVVLYEDKNGNTVLGEIGKNNLEYKNGELTQGNNKISHFNLVYMSPTWVINDIDRLNNNNIRYSYSTLVRTRYEQKAFTHVLLEIQRDTIDKSIIGTADDGKKVYGRYLNVDNTNKNEFDVEVLRIEPLLENKKIVQLGVWGQPNLPLIINGEEIKVGPSGQFELKDYEITSLGVCVRSTDDKFVIDYLEEQ